MPAQIVQTQQQESILILIICNMKIALLNDTHFGCRNDSPAFIEYQNRFDDE